MNRSRSLDGRVIEAATSSRLLVIVDFDGTIADLASHPAAARPRQVAAERLAVLATLVDTHVAIVSGRSLSDLRRAVAPIPDVGLFHLYGSHGLEGDDGTLVGMAPGTMQRRVAIARLARRTVELHPVAWVEEKSYGDAIHFGGLDESGGRLLTATVERLAATLPGCFVKQGRRVVEVSALPMNKGFAVDLLQHDLVPDVTIYAGDDRTDEDAFDALWPCDIGIKIGDGPSGAEFRLDSPAQLEDVLGILCDRRADPRC